jgi:uncharacterized membrane-anchored protein YhcB (DUF1043 family)
MNTILQNIWVRYVLILFIGISVGVLFYPTKSITERVSQKYEQQITQMTTQFQTYKSTSEEKITSLTSQITDLSTHQKVVYEKVIKPDGTVTIHRTVVKDSKETESATSQTEQDKVTKIQSEFASKEKTYQDTISTLEKSKTVTVNGKKFGLEFGYTSDSYYYLHPTMDLWGPIYIGLQGETNKTDSRLGFGLGIRF